MESKVWKSFKTLAPQVGLEPTTLRLTAESDAFCVLLPAVASCCSLALNLLFDKKLRVACSCSNVSSEAGCWCTE